MLADAQRLQGVGVQPRGIFSAAKIIAPSAIDHGLAKMGGSGLAGPQLHAQGQTASTIPQGRCVRCKKVGEAGMVARLSGGLLNTDLLYIKPA